MVHVDPRLVLYGACRGSVYGRAHYAFSALSWIHRHPCRRCRRRRCFVSRRCLRVVLLLPQERCNLLLDKLFIVVLGN